MGREKAVNYIISRIIAGERDLQKIKNEAGKRFGLSRLPKNTELMKKFPKGSMTKEILLLLKRKPMRTLSGVSPIAVMIKPEGSCPWKCIYCPFTGKAAKSYTGEEPAALRARESGFDPYVQVRTRLKQFELIGHPTDKCEVIVMGGTFLRMPKKYRDSFIKNIYDALNGKKSRGIEEAKKINEKSRHRMVGLTIETRPDVCGKKEIDETLGYGATRVELGVQHPDNRIYRIINRGHSVKEVADATRRLKDTGLKVVYHLMPGLPGSDKKKDMKMIEKIFADERFKPDMLKIYPTLVMPGTALYNMMKEGRYEPLDDKKAVEIISEWYRKVPEYVRVMRIQRDIPAGLIDSGVKKSNLRELVEKRIREKNIGSMEIRGREIGLRKGKVGKTELKVKKYRASGGMEFFISLSSCGLLVGFIRLRIPGKSLRKEIGKNTAIIRELHVYGEEAEINKEGEVQHRGFGRMLLEEAEGIAKKQFRSRKMAIISGVGAREYYRKLGYKREGPYMVRRI